MYDFFNSLKFIFAQKRHKYTQNENSDYTHIKHNHYFMERLIFYLSCYLFSLASMLKVACGTASNLCLGINLPETLHIP